MQQCRFIWLRGHHLDLESTFSSSTLTLPYSITRYLNVTLHDSDSYSILTSILFLNFRHLFFRHNYHSIFLSFDIFFSIFLVSMFFLSAFFIPFEKNIANSCKTLSLKINFSLKTGISKHYHYLQLYSSKVSILFKILFISF